VNSYFQQQNNNNITGTGTKSPKHPGNNENVVSIFKASQRPLEFCHLLDFLK